MGAIFLLSPTFPPRNGFTALPFKELPPLLLLFRAPLPEKFPLNGGGGEGDDNFVFSPPRSTSSDSCASYHFSRASTTGFQAAAAKKISAPLNGRSLFLYCFLMFRSPQMNGREGSQSNRCSSLSIASSSTPSIAARADKIHRVAMKERVTNEVSCLSWNVCVCFVEAYARTHVFAPRRPRDN